MKRKACVKNQGNFLEFFVVFSFFWSPNLLVYGFCVLQDHDFGQIDVVASFLALDNVLAFEQVAPTLYFIVAANYS